MAVLEGCGDAMGKIRCVQFEFGGCHIDARIYFQDFWYFLKERDFDVYRISQPGLIRVRKYSQNCERFIFANYIAVNRNLK